MDLLQLAGFHAVAAHGGFSAASRATRTPKGTLSRRVKALENALGVRLFERGPRALRLTEDGDALRARTAAALAELADAGDEIAGRAARPRGRLRVSVPSLFAQRGFGAVVAAFVAGNPEVLLEVFVQDRFVDPIAEDIDIVVRVNPAPDSPLVGQCLYRDELVVAARPGTPRPDESGTAAAVVLASRPEAETWTYDARGASVTLRPRPVLRVASMVLILDAVVAGAGVGLIPESLATSEAAAGRLDLWGKLTGRHVEVWMLCPSRQLRSAKVTAFMTALSDAYKR